MIKPQILWPSLFLLLSIAVVYFANSSILGIREFATAGLGLVGTFLGAMFAFRLNEQKEKAKDISSRKVALNKALFTIMRQHGIVSGLRAQLGPHTSDFERAINCPAYLAPDVSTLRIDFESISFLFESGHPDVLMKLVAEEESFRQAVKTVEVRSRFILDEVQPAIEVGSLNNRSFSPEDFVGKIGERIFESAVNYARLMYEEVESSFSGLSSVHSELFTVAKELFPNSLFVKPAYSVLEKMPNE